MYTLFLVEDEYLIRASLRSQIEQLAKSLPISFIGEAGDGELALSAIIDLQPDIVITDIKMPFMNGIELATEIKRINPWVHVLFISGFDEFSYAKAAIQLKIEDYLLKPIKFEQLEQSLTSIVNSLKQKDSTAIKKEDVQHLYHEEIIRNYLVNGLFDGNLPMNTVIEETKKIQRKLVGSYSIVILASNNKSKNATDYFLFSEKIAKLFGEDPEIIYSSLSSRFIKFIISSGDSITALEKSYQVARTLLHEFQRDIPDLAIAIGPDVQRISQIPESYQTAKILLQSYGSIRSERIISFEDNLKDGELSPTNPFKLNLAEKIHTLSYKELPTFIHYLLGESEVEESRKRMFRFFVVTELNHLLKKKPTSADDTPIELVKTAQDILHLVQSEERYTLFLKQSLNYLKTIKVHPSMLKYRSTIIDAVHYIDENYTDQNLSLNSVAASMNLSPSHFSTIFSQSLEKTFVEYLTEKRIERTKFLLVHSNEKLAAIASDVGYSDPNYLSFLFKKKEGTTPSEFRRLNQIELT